MRFRDPFLVHIAATTDTRGLQGTLTENDVVQAPSGFVRQQAGVMTRLRIPQRIEFRL